MDPSSFRPRVYVVVMAVDGVSFTTTETSGALDGKGTLSGQHWQWTSWVSTSRLANGLVVAAKAELTAEGLHVTKRFPGQGAENYSEETFTTISKEEYEFAKKEMLSK
jgi:hypothetical protein